MTRYLLDTHILVWWRLDPTRLNSAQRTVLGETGRKDRLGLSAISLLELANMFQRGRLRLHIGFEAWLEDIETHPSMDLLPLDGRIAVKTIQLGDDFHKDPADRIIVATALAWGLTLLTLDSRIRKWGKVQTI